MNVQEATYVANTVSNLSTYYKSMDITSQLTQLTALSKLSMVADFSSEHQQCLKQCITRRQNKLSLCLEALYVLEKEWDSDLLLLSTLLGAPDNGKSVTL